MTAGLRFTGSLIWVGIVNFNIQNNTFNPPNYNISAAVQPSLVVFGSSLVSTASVVTMTFVMKIPPGAVGRTSLRITSSTPNVGICGVSAQKKKELKLTYYFMV